MRRILLLTFLLTSTSGTRGAAQFLRAGDRLEIIGGRAVVVAQVETLSFVESDHTPNLKHFEMRLDDGAWKTAEPMFSWNLHPGENKLEARTINQFGVAGPVSIARISVGDH
jgi:hypothetical protein